MFYRHRPGAESGSFLCFPDLECIRRHILHPRRVRCYWVRIGLLIPEVLLTMNAVTCSDLQNAGQLSDGSFQEL